MRCDLLIDIFMIKNKYAIIFYSFKATIQVKLKNELVWGHFEQN